MVDKSPLSLTVEPGEYLCTWSVPDQDGGVVDAHGDLRVEANRSPQGTVYGQLPLKWEKTLSGGHSAGLPQTVDQEVLHGSLANGNHVTLIDAAVDYWGPGQGSIRAGAALIGQQQIATDGSPTFGIMKMQVGALDALAGVAPIRSTGFPPFEDEHLAGTWSATGEPASSQEWSDDSATLRLEYDGSMRIADAYSYRLAFSPVVVVEVGDPLLLDEWVDRWVEPVRKVTCLATGRKEDVTYLAVGASGARSPASRLQVFGSGLTQSPYESRSEEVREIRTAIILKPDDLSLLSLVRTWQQLRQAHHPLIETYGALLTAPDQHPRSRFLLLIQALEGLYGYETKETFEVNRSSHTTKREALLASLLPHADADERNFLKRFLRKQPPVSLDEALRNLTTGLPVDLTPSLAATGLVRQVMGDPRRPDGPHGALRLMRNDLAHGTKGYEPHDITQVTALLERVVRANALRILGCGQEVQRRVLDLA